MTNRINYPIVEYKYTKAAEVQELRDYLVKTGQPVTLAGATIQLAEFNRLSPGEWTLTLEDLVTLWAESEAL